MGPRKIFIDTGAWFALIDRNDQFHSRASKFLRTSKTDKNVAFFTSNFVLHETIMLLMYKISKKASLTFWHTVGNDDFLERLAVTPDVETEAMEIFEKYGDQDFSIVDCTSFVLMKRSKIKEAFSFDRHFKIMKFEMLPD